MLRDDRTFEIFGEYLINGDSKTLADALQFKKNKFEKNYETVNNPKKSKYNKDI